MKKLFYVLLVFIMAIPVSAQKKTNFKVTGHAPTITGGTGAADYNKAIENVFGDVLQEINNQLNEIKFGNPEMLLQAMGDASVYASHGATTRGYGGYKVFSATVGPMFGVQLPAGITSIINDMGNLSDSLKEEGDVKLGINPNVLNAQFGLNMGVFKIDNLYLGLRIGYFNLPDLEGLNFNSFTLGIMVNYQIVPSISLAGLVAWRGVSLGSGFIYNNSKIGFTAPLGNDIKQDIATGGYIYMKPEASLNLNVNTFTIPLEAITSIKLLIFNIPFGVGADLAFGKTSLGFGVNSDIELKDLPSGYKDNKDGDIYIDAQASNIPSIFNFKIMTGFGFSMGPVIIDIPFTYYPASGYNIGITIGAVF
ncbi:MAG: hypothetical protein LBV17_10755 [Treponema sp.]|jgi:hypothetical protein|nr:hypothetical protein [Treponema sp.]